MTHVTLLDGGMGQELVRRSGKAPTPLWSTSVMQEQAGLVQTLHEDFIKAGADVITTNAYTCTPCRLARDANESLFEPLQITACEIALKARDSVGRSTVKVAGCLPPLVASYRPDLALGDDESRRSYQRICDIQSRYVDLFICETMSSIEEALIAGTVACETGLPTCMALSLDDEKPYRLRSGELLSDALQALAELPLQALLLNCSRPETISHAWPILSAGSHVATGAYANGFTAIDALKPGETVSSLEARHDLGPQAYANFAMEWVANGATMVGGCCEVGPEHIACLRERLG